MNSRWLLPGKPGSGSLTLDRLNCLTDGVVAIVLTLLVLGIEVPSEHSFKQDGLLPFLLKIEYQLTVYAVSFVLIGSYWIQHNVMFHFFRNGSRTLIWLNFLFLFFLTLLPFTTQLIGTYRHEPLVIVIYGVVHVACGLSLALMWWYANRMAPIVWPRIDPVVAQVLLRRTLMGPAVSILAIGAAFLNVRLAHFVFLTIPFFHFSNRTVDSHWPQVVEEVDTTSD